MNFSRGGQRTKEEREKNTWKSSVIAKITPKSIRSRSLSNIWFFVQTLHKAKNCQWKSINEHKNFFLVILSLTSVIKWRKLILNCYDNDVIKLVIFFVFIWDFCLMELTNAQVKAINRFEWIFQKCQWIKLNEIVTRGCFTTQINWLKSFLYTQFIIER